MAIPTAETVAPVEFDPVLDEDPTRNKYVVLPIRYPKIWDLYLKAQASFWTVAEVDLSRDTAAWLRLPEPEQNFIKHVLAFFAASDGIVNENIAERLLRRVKMPEAKFFLGFQIAMENVHSEMYARLLEAYVTDAKERNRLFNAIATIPSIKAKADWCSTMFNDDAPDCDAILGAAITELIFFSASFAAIYYLRYRGIELPGLTFSNELISRDEGLHGKFDADIYNELPAHKKRPDDEVVARVTKAVDLESKSVHDSLKVDLIGMNATLMVQYVQYVADSTLEMIHLKPVYKVDNPFSFMKNLSLGSKVNFFERRNASYQKSNVVAHGTEGGDDDTAAFSTTEDF